LTEKEVTQIQAGPKSAETLVREYRETQAEEGPAERWRKPIRPVAVEHDTSRAMFDGNVMRAGYNATFDAETVERFRQGRGCIRCWEPLETAFPEACPLCGYGVREFQPADFTEEFEGVKHIGPTTTLHDEFERMELEGQRKRHQPGSSVLLPGKDF
jgi:hypothetical protein